MKMKKLVQNKRESDGTFALRLESEASVQRDLRNSAIAAQRKQQVREENAEWAAQMGLAVEELDGLFA